MPKELSSADLYHWMETNKDKTGTPDFNKVQVAYNELSAYEKKRDLFEKAQGGDQEAAKEVLSTIIPWAGQKAAEMGIKGGAVVAGDIAGQRAFGKIGGMLGRAGGAAVGSFINRAVTGEEFKPGELTADIMANALNVRGAVTNAVMNASAEALRQVIDEKRVNLAGLSEAGAAGVAGAQASKAITKSYNARDALYKYRDELFRKLQPEGVVVSPPELGRMEALSRIAGRGPLDYSSVEKNQYVWQKMARQELGMPVNENDLAFRPDRRNQFGALLDGGDFRQALDKAYAPYKEIAALSEQANKDLADFQGKAKAAGNFTSAMQSQQAKDLLISAGADIDAIKVARDDMKTLWLKMKAGDPQAAIDWRAKKLEVDALETKLEAAATAWGRPGLKDELNKSRNLIARIYAVENATTNSYGLLDVSELAAMRNAGYPLTGKLALMADFAEAFSRQAADAVKLAPASAPGVGVNYAIRNVAQGNVGGPVAMGVPYLSETVRDFLLSPQVQSKITQPILTPNPETAAALAVRSGLMTGGRDNTAINERLLPAKKPNQ